MIDPDPGGRNASEKSKAVASGGIGTAGQWPALSPENYFRHEAIVTVVSLCLVGKCHVDVAGDCRKTMILTLEVVKDSAATNANEAEKASVGADPAPLVADTGKDETCVTEEVHVWMEIFAALNNSVYCRMLDALTAALETNLQYPDATLHQKKWSGMMCGPTVAKLNRLTQLHVLASMVRTLPELHEAAVIIHQVTLGVGKIPVDRLETEGNATFHTGGEEEKLEKELSCSRGMADRQQGATALVMSLATIRQRACALAANGYMVVAPAKPKKSLMKEQSTEVTIWPLGSLQESLPFSVLKQPTCHTEEDDCLQAVSDADHENGTGASAGCSCEDMAHDRKPTGSLYNMACGVVGGVASRVESSIVQRSTGYRRHKHNSLDTFALIGLPFGKNLNHTRDCKIVRLSSCRVDYCSGPAIRVDS